MGLCKGCLVIIGVMGVVGIKKFWLLGEGYVGVC